MNAPSVVHQKYREYFEEFLPGIQGKLMIEDLNDLNCCVAIEVTDSDDPTWLIGITDGRLTYVGHEHRDYTSTFALDLDTLIDIVTAACTPQDAFFSMRIDIQGDIAMGLQLSTVLEVFFDRYPFTA